MNLLIILVMKNFMKFTKTFNLILYILFIYNISYAQQKTNEDKMLSIKIAYITEKIELTSKQSEKFWPIYFELEDKLRAINKQKRSFDNLSDEQLNEALMQQFKDEKRKIEIKETYINKFRDVISIRQLYNLYKSEKSFKRELIKRMNNKLRR